MPSFAETLPESARSDIAFYLFADLWPACTPARPLPILPASELAYLSDRDLWEKHGRGAAPASAATSAEPRSYDPVQYRIGPVSLWTNCEWG